MSVEQDCRIDALRIELAAARAEIMELSDNLSFVEEVNRELRACATAGQLQAARERRQGATYPWHRPRPVYERTDPDGPMWRPGEA